MNPDLFDHTGTVERLAQAANAGTAQRDKSKSTIVASLRCRVEGLRGSARATLAGRVAQATFTISWGTDALKEEDLFTWSGGPGATGKQYVIREIIYDNTRATGAYHTAILQERRK